MYAASGLDTDTITIVIVDIIKEPTQLGLAFVFSLSLQYLLTLKQLYYEEIISLIVPYGYWN